MRLHKGVIEYIPDNNAAAEDFKPQDPAWVVARTEEPGEEGLPFGKPLYLDAQCGKVVLTDGQIAGGLELLSYAGFAACREPERSPGHCT